VTRVLVTGFEPFNGGAVDNLALLTPGVLTPGDTDFTNGVGISANG